MRDDQRRQRLTDANPWWRAVAGGQDPTAWTEHHPVLKGRAAHDLGFRAGVLDDVQIYSTALDQSQIQGIMGTSPALRPVASWHLDEAVGTIDPWRIGPYTARAEHGSKTAPRALCGSGHARAERARSSDGRARDF